MYVVFYCERVPCSGCVEQDVAYFSVRRRQRTSISSQIPCDRPTWQRAQLWRGGGGVDAFPLAFLVCLFCFLLPFPHFHFIPPTLSLLPSPSWAWIVELTDGATHLLLDMLEPWLLVLIAWLFFFFAAYHWYIILCLRNIVTLADLTALHMESLLYCGAIHKVTEWMEKLQGKLHPKNVKKHIFLERYRLARWCSG